MILQPIDTPISPALYLTFAAISKLFAALTTYPYQVVLYCSVLYCTDNLPLPGGAGEAAGHGVQVLRHRGLRQEDNQASSSSIYLFIYLFIYLSILSIYDDLSQMEL